MKGRVVSEDENGKVTISLMQDTDEHCKACGMGDSCGLTQVNSLEVKLDSDCDIHVNDFVDVEVPPKTLLLLSASVYILPLLTMVAGAVAVSSLGDKATILGGLAGLAVGVIFNILLNKYLSLPKIVKVRRLV